MGQTGPAGFDGHTIRKYRPKSRRSRSQSWRTFLQNHAGAVAAMDFFVVQTVTFRLLYVLIVITHERREVIHLVRPHRSLAHDSPIPRPVQLPHLGKVIEIPLVGGLHHHYQWQAA
jgi:hypothetical protein